MYVCWSVRPSVRTIQLENHWTELDESWYGRCASGEYPKIVIFNFGNNKMAEEEICDPMDTLATLTTLVAFVLVAMVACLPSLARLP
jgi:hypothetical protein